MTILDTSVLVGSLSGTKNSAPFLRALIEAGERILIPSLVLYEWLRGLRVLAEIAAQEPCFPRLRRWSSAIAKRRSALRFFKL